MQPVAMCTTKTIYETIKEKEKFCSRRYQCMWVQDREHNCRRNRQVNRRMRRPWVKWAHVKKRVLHESIMQRVDEL